MKPRCVLLGLDAASTGFHADELHGLVVEERIKKSDGVRAAAHARDEQSVKLLGVEAGGRGIQPEQHAARFQGGSLGVLQGTRSYILQDEFGQIQSTHSVSAGLDYAAVGPEHAWLRDASRAEYTYATDDQALEAFMKLARLEGIIPALESAHAVAEVMVRAPKMPKDALIIVNLSGRGDKDVAQVADKVKLQMPK